MTTLTRLEVGDYVLVRGTLTYWEGRHGVVVEQNELNCAVMFYDDDYSTIWFFRSSLVLVTVSEELLEAALGPDYL